MHKPTSLCWALFISSQRICYWACNYGSIASAGAHAQQQTNHMPLLLSIDGIDGPPNITHTIWAASAVPKFQVPGCLVACRYLQISLFADAVQRWWFFEWLWTWVTDWSVDANPRNFIASGFLWSTSSTIPWLSWLCIVTVVIVRPHCLVA